MTRRLLVTVMGTLALTGTVLFAGAAPAGACSCIENPPAPPIAFTGTALEMVEAGSPPLWRFRTDAVLRGDPGPEPVVQLYVPVEMGDGTTASTSCDIFVTVLPGRRYQVEPVSDVIDGRELLSVNACGGSLTALTAAAAPEMPLASDGRALAITASVALVGLISVAIIAWAHRRRWVPPRP